MGYSALYTYKLLFLVQSKTNLSLDCDGISWKRRRLSPVVSWEVNE